MLIFFETLLASDLARSEVLRLLIALNESVDCSIRLFFLDPDPKVGSSASSKY